VELLGRTLQKSKTPVEVMDDTKNDSFDRSRQLLAGIEQLKEVTSLSPGLLPVNPSTTMANADSVISGTFLIESWLVSQGER
jgi:hypothetical protein